MDNVNAREAANRLARSDPEQALAIARTIRDPWYRCQALAWVGRYAGTGIAKRALDEAVEAAAQGSDGYRRLTVLAWPIRAAIERGLVGLAERWLKAALKDIGTVEPIPSRAETLWWLWAAVLPGGPKLRTAVRAAVLAHCPPDRSWRAERLYRYMAATLAMDDPDDARSLIEAMPPGKARTRIEKCRAAGELAGPQSFFW
jgi:hypothetical protein